MNKTEKDNFRRVFGVPVVLAIVSIVGLLSALLADGWGDVLSWLGVGNAARRGAAIFVDQGIGLSPRSA